MTDTYIQLTEDEFDEQYPLIENHLDPHASWAFDDGRGCLFGTYGEEIRFVSQQDPRRIWTFVDGDDVNQYVISGFHFINRVGYLVSNVPVPEGLTIEVLIINNQPQESIMQRTVPVNPFYAARFSRVSPAPTDTDKPIFVRLPRAPVNTSPVPGLTSLYHFHRAGEYGDRNYPGNCGGNLIRDLLLFFKPGLVLDPFAGSGTCLDVCQELKIPCMSWDIHRGIDACDPQGFSKAEAFDFIWAHPPYWRMKLYAEDPRDLSRAPTLEEFLRRYRQFIRNCAAMLKPGGKLAILMGDYQDREAGFVPLTFHTKRIAFECGLTQPCTDIVRFSHGASSSRKVYRTSFIPGLHDVCMIFGTTI